MEKKEIQQRTKNREAQEIKWTEKEETLQQTKIISDLIKNFK